eukprot:UN09152
MGNMHHDKVPTFAIIFVISVGIVLCMVSVCVYKKRKENRMNNEINENNNNQHVHEAIPMGVNESEDLARALAQSAMEGHETTKNQSGVTVSAAQFIAPAGFDDKVNDNEDDNVGLIN